jgi:transposase
MTFKIDGLKGNDFVINANDALAVKMMMLYEGHCTIGVKEACKKFGYTEQRYYQLLNKYKQGGAIALADKKRGSEKKPVRTEVVVNQIIRLRFLDPLASCDVLAQKLKQMGYPVSKRSVERTITEYGLKKNSLFQPGKAEAKARKKSQNIKTRNQNSKD